MIEKIIALLLGDFFKKKPWRVWGIKPGMAAWKDFGTASRRRAKIFEAYLFVEGWRVLVLGRDLKPPAPSEDEP